MKTAFLIISLLFIFFLFPRYDNDVEQSTEDTFCGSIDNLISMLDDYKEVLLFNGISSDSQMHMLTINTITRTWTEFTLNKDGLVCIMQEGTDAVISPTVSKTIDII